MRRLLPILYAAAIAGSYACHKNDSSTDQTGVLHVRSVQTPPTPVIGYIADDSTWTFRQKDEEIGVYFATLGFPLGDSLDYSFEYPFVGSKKEIQELDENFNRGDLVYVHYIKGRKETYFLRNDSVLVRAFLPSEIMMVRQAGK